MLLPDALKFAGPAPHIINKRLAMLGFIWGALAELHGDQPVIEQAAGSPLLVTAVTALTTWASLIPIMKGAKSEAFGTLSIWPQSEVPWLKCQTVVAVGSVSFGPYLYT